MTQKEAFFLFKHIQYEEAREMYNRTALAGDKNAEINYRKALIELDEVYYLPEDNLLSAEEIERSLMQDAKS